MTSHPLTDDQQALLAAYATAVRESPHNLLSRRALDELESRHIAESVAFARTLPEDADVLDVGTGGGLPGMVIAITRPDLRVALLDSTRKKIEFLREFAQESGVSVQTLHGRAEDLQREYGASYDVVVARAVAPLERLVGWTVPFLRPGGHLHAIKGKQWPDELKAALPELRGIGATVVDVPGRGEATSSTADGDTTPAAMPRVVIIRAAG